MERVGHFAKMVSKPNKSSQKPINIEHKKKLMRSKNMYSWSLDASQGDTEENTSKEFVYFDESSSSTSCNTLGVEETFGGEPSIGALGKDQQT